MLSTADADGNQDASPKGDAPGFVAIEDRNTLLIPDRKGNKLLFGLQNILANPRVGILFITPPTSETLRVNGTAELIVDPAILERLAARGSPAQVAIRVTVRECFFHCAKAFIRSELWKHEKWAEPIKISFGKYLAGKMSAARPTQLLRLLPRTMPPRRIRPPSKPTSHSRSTPSSRKTTRPICSCCQRVAILNSYCKLVAIPGV